MSEVFPVRGLIHQARGLGGGRGRTKRGAAGVQEVLNDVNCCHLLEWQQPDLRMKWLLPESG
jgi:hypothetical protein